MYEVLNGDCLAVLRTLPDGSVNCVVTSPPYWGLRDYGTASWEGGDGLCDHLPPDEAPNSNKMTVGQKTSHAGRFAGPNCFKCGARRIDLQLGLEETPEDYVLNMVAVFREVRRVLADDGVLWLNLGDSYWNNFGGGSGTMTTGNAEAVRQRGRHNKQKHDLFKIKDLVGIPWRVALALQADGWYLRQDIIWHKPNPMPESVRDRCTKAHEYLFLLTKSPRYYFDAAAIAEPLAESSKQRLAQDIENQKGSDRVPGKTNGTMKAVASGIRFGGSKYGDSDDPEHATKSGNEWVASPDAKRNRRSVWTISTRPYKGAHFATFPPALVEPCILAGCPTGGTVLDPFAGSGTTLDVAEQHGRNSIGIELNPEYIDLIHQRMAKHRQLNVFHERGTHEQHHSHRQHRD